MKEKLPENALEKVSELIQFVDKDKLREELITFMSVWPSICRKSFEQDYSTGKIESSENIQETENTEEVLNPLEVDEETVGEETVDFSACTVKQKCNSCIKCAFEDRTLKGQSSPKYRKSINNNWENHSFDNLQFHFLLEQPLKPKQHS
ncbi:hypothetical protein J6590_068536 [Homalodisca vitripennis]|nr:hypothetical protein J6590_068536 [Homalodisca vitripennis]